MQAIHSLILSAVLAACNSQPAKAPKTPLEQVQRWAGDKQHVGAVSEVATPGLELFEVSDPAQTIPMDGNRSFRLVAVAGGVGKPILEDAPSIVKAAAAATKDPMVLARVGLLANGRDETPLAGPEDDHQRAEKVTAPELAGDTVAFWTFAGAPSRSLTHYALDLKTGKLTR